MRVTPAPLSCGEFRVYCGASFAWLFGLFASRWHLKSSQLCTRRRHWRRCRPMRSASQCQRQRRQVTISASCAGWSRPRTSSSRAATNACAGRARPPSVSSAQCAAGLSWVCAGFSCVQAFRHLHKLTGVPLEERSWLLHASPPRGVGYFPKHLRIAGRFGK